jgi:hypothetical protein
VFPLCLSIPHINFGTSEPIFVKFGIYIMEPGPISTAYVINPSHPSACLYVYPLIVARQRLSKNFTAGTSTHAKIEEMLAGSFSMRSVSYQNKVGEYFFPDLVITSISQNKIIILMLNSLIKYHVMGSLFSL